MVELEEEERFIRNREINLVSCMLVYFVEFRELLKNCIFEVIEKVNVILDFFFGFLIEVLLVLSFDFIV